MAPASGANLLRISAFHSNTHNQTGPLWCWFPSGWTCACPRPLGVSPMTSPVRLGVSPAATPTPRGVFTQRFEALFPRAGALGCAVCFVPRCLSGLFVRECGATGLASGQTACPVSPTIRQSRSRHRHASPLCPSCPCLRPSYPGLEECLFFISLVSDFLAVGFSVSSGCARRRSVSTSAAILVPRSCPISKHLFLCLFRFSVWHSDWYIANTR